MQTGGELEDLDATKLFNVAVAELYRTAELTAETHAARTRINDAIEELSQQAKINEAIEQQETPATNGSEIPRVPEPEGDFREFRPVSVGQQELNTGKKMGSFDDLVLPPD